MHELKKLAPSGLSDVEEMPLPITETGSITSEAEEILMEEIFHTEFKELRWDGTAALYF
jgi:hypothetical protein